MYMRIDIKCVCAPKSKVFGCHYPHHGMFFFDLDCFLCFGGMNVMYGYKWKVFLGSDLDLHDSEFLNLGER